MTRSIAGAITALIPIALAACEGDSTEPVVEESALLSVIPAGGAVGVDINLPITIQFSHSMMQGMEEYADVHEGEVEGPLVNGTWSWNATFTELTFTPDAPLMPQTQYVIHIGGGMRDEEGRHIDYEQHGFGMGGEWMTEQMHQGGQHGYGTGHGGMGGMGGGTGMGQGWIHPGNGGYGMIFTFTTA
jgi:hypothetical protein